MARPKKEESQVRLPASTNLLPDVLEEIDHLSLELERSRSWLIEKFTMRGLADFKRDGQFDETDEVSVRVTKANQNEARKKSEPKRTMRSG